MTESEIARQGRLRRNAAYRAAHRAELVEKAKQWRLDNPEKATAVKKRATAYAKQRRHKWAREHREEIAAEKARRVAERREKQKISRREKSRRWATANPDKVKAMSTAYGKTERAAACRAKHYRNGGKEKTAAWAKANPGKRKAIGIAYRTRKLGNGGRHTAEDVAAILAAQGGKCAYCRTKPTRPEVDHVVPLALGGTNDKANLQIVCRTCNARKGAKHPIAFAQSIGLLL